MGILRGRQGKVVQILPPHLFILYWLQVGSKLASSVWCGPKRSGSRLLLFSIRHNLNKVIFPTCVGYAQVGSKLAQDDMLGSKDMQKCSLAIMISSIAIYIYSWPCSSSWACITMWCLGLFVKYSSIALQCVPGLHSQGVSHRVSPQGCHMQGVDFCIFNIFMKFLKTDININM